MMREKRTEIEALAELDVQIRPLIRLEAETEPEALRSLATENAAVLLSRAQDVLPCREAGIGDVFLETAQLPEAAMAEVFSACHFVLNDRDALLRLDRVAAAHLSEGYMENVTLALSPTSADESIFTPHNIPQTARLIRRSEALAVRGVILDLTGKADVSAAAREAFSLVKKLRSDLPCVLHCFCMNGLLQPLAEGNEELIKTLKMLASLNDTSLYADFLIG